MNFGKLLGAGKSFISGGKPAAYRTDKRVYLPQFGSPKNPFTPSAAATATQVELPKPAEKIPERPWMKTQKLSSVVAKTNPVWSGTWTSRLNPVSFFRAAPDAGDNCVAAVQTELSLEKVKVVHNDLTDADVEIVPLKSRPVATTFSSSQPKKSWDALSERILRATAL
jgi:hypothetical protein